MQDFAKWFYASKSWQATRDAFMACKRGLCEQCGARGNICPAHVVHHRQKLTPQNIRDPAIALDWANLEALCHDCHNKAHPRNKKPDRYTFDAQGRVIPQP